MKLLINLRNGQFIEVNGLTKEENETIHQGIMESDWVSTKAGIIRVADITHTSFRPNE